MHPEEPTDKLAIQIWWALTWRSVPLSMLAAFLFAFIIGLIAGLTKTDPHSLSVPGAIGGALIGLFITVKIIKRLMTKGFGEYRLVIVKK